MGMPELKAMASKTVTDLFKQRQTITVEGVFEDDENCQFDCVLERIRKRHFPREVIRSNGRKGIAERHKLVNYLARKARENGFDKDDASRNCVAVRSLRYNERTCAPGGLVTSIELAELLCSGRSTISGWIDRYGMPKAVSVKGSTYYWDEAEVREWVSESFGQEVVFPLLSRAQVILAVSKISSLPIETLIERHGMPKALEFEGSAFMRRWNPLTFIKWLRHVRFE